MTDFAHIESIFRRINREIWIVTAADGERRGGLLATWVSQASIDSQQPVALIGVAPNHFTAELIDTSRCFGLHLITAGQIDHAWNFAIGSGRSRDKLDGVATSTKATGSPILSDCAAWLDCRVFARLPTGDRIYYWADVLDGGRNSDEDPLNERELFSVASAEQKQQLLAARDLDIDLQRPMQEMWRNDLPDYLQPKN